MPTGTFTLIMGYEFKSCGILQLKMQGWVGRVTLCTGEFFMGGPAITKGRVAFNNPICLGFSSPSSLDNFCRSLCGFLGGLGAAAILILAWILSH